MSEFNEENKVEGGEESVENTDTETNTEADTTADTGADEATVEGGETGETGEETPALDGSDSDDSEDDEEEGDPTSGEVPADVTVAKYKIIGEGLNFYDGQGQVQGQYVVGTVQELPTFVGDAAVANGQAEKIEE